MEENEQEQMLCYPENIKNIVIKELDRFSDAELTGEELEVLSKLVDIDKDLENIDYWKVKKEVMKMRYNNYRDYAEERFGNYGRRGVPGTGRSRYRGNDDGEEIIEDMRESYNAYSESREAYGRGNYNAGHDSMEALEDTMRLFTEFTQKMIDEVDTPEAKQIIKKHLRKISQMG